MPQRRHAQLPAVAAAALAASLVYMPAYVLGLSLAGAPAASGQMAPEGRLRVDPRVMSSRCITQVSPLWPQVPQADGPVSVTLDILVTRRGAVQPLDAISGPAAFHDAARSAVRLWRYHPFLHGDSPVAVITQVTVTFVPGAPGGMISHPNP